MAPMNPASKAVALLVRRRSLFTNRSNYNQIRVLSTICGANAFSSAGRIVGGGYRNCNLRNSFDFSDIGFQKRGFLGCNDGEEGTGLSRKYEERRVIGYSPEQMFNVVAAVDMYQDFLPWCQRSEIIRRNPDGTLDAELEIGFKFLVESYVSHVELHKPKSIKTTSSQTALFDHLINIWEFNPGPIPGTCNLYFFVDFKFQSPLYRSMANMFFKEVVSRLVGSFDERCRLIYGPGKLGFDEKSFVVDLKKGEVKEGTYDGKPDATFSFTDDVFIKVASGEMSPQIAFMRGSMKISGSISAATKFTPDIFPKSSKM